MSGSMETDNIAASVLLGLNSILLLAVIVGSSPLVS
jgi:hypothetical protein